uniref:Uncharacterized protein n=1 Tax=Arundo donax TaxID=35708 RepID=A0A0A9EMW3_ARUDO
MDLLRTIDVSCVSRTLDCCICHSARHLMKVCYNLPHQAGKPTNILQQENKQIVVLHAEHRGPRNSSGFQDSQ